MDDKQFEKLQKATIEALQKSLSDELSEKLAKHLETIQTSRHLTDEMLRGTVNEIVDKKLGTMNETIREIKKSIEPTIEILEHLSWGRKFVVGFLGFVVLLGAAVGAIYAALLFIRGHN